MATDILCLHSDCWHNMKLGLCDRGVIVLQNAIGGALLCTDRLPKPKVKEVTSVDTR